MSKDFTTLRAKYPVFRYESYSIEREAGYIALRWRFSIPGLADFEPVTRIKTDNLEIVNAPDSPRARAMVFALGLCEAVSYWKCACPPAVEILCGTLDEWGISWWKALWYHGLGEFFYRNNIKPDFSDFVTFKSAQSACEPDSFQISTFRSQIRLIPIGGGKDSCVTLNLLGGDTISNRLFTINDQCARTQCALAAGYGQEDIVRAYRSIDPALLRLNGEGYLNGHTPFSAVTAFLSVYCAYLIGAGEVALSNESSANEPSVAGTDINHQYSKSYAFEADFREYCTRHFSGGPEYYSLLRPFNELQIAARFSALREFYPVFRSCNAGSKSNTWCGKCGKCLFTFGLLSAFLPPEELVEIFGANLFEDGSLLPEFEGLCGLRPVKPFDCVGTAGEYNAALSMALRRWPADNLPFLLKEFAERVGLRDPSPYLLERNEQHFVPPELLPMTEEMYRHAASFL